MQGSGLHRTLHDCASLPGISQKPCQFMYRTRMQLESISSVVRSSMQSGGTFSCDAMP